MASTAGSSRARRILEGLKGLLRSDAFSRQLAIKETLQLPSAEELREEGLALLRKALGDPSAQFRPGQWEAIERLLRDRARLLVVQRTGWGKSIVYFVATRLLRRRGSGPTLLISPLLALMRNQIAMAERLGVQAATINSSNRREWSIVEERLSADEVDILLISPERLANEAFRRDVLLPLALRVGLLVVDEAHCISDWGHDFRPDYRRIVRVLRALPPNVPVLATTATANDRVVHDVVAQLGHSLRAVRGPLGRPGLRLQSIYLPDQGQRMAWLAEHLPELPGSGIVYTLTVRDARRVAGWLQSQGIAAYGYWGGLDTVSRVRLENRLLANEVKALVATSALGMGFDKPDLGFVVHFQRPSSVVHYYQQVGRAGRDIGEAFGILLSGDEDYDIVDYFIRTAFPPEGHAEEVLAALEQASDGLTLAMIQGRVNFSRRQIEKVLHLLSVETPAPVSRQGRRWYRNPVRYRPDHRKVERLTRVRRQEQAQMLSYLWSRDCLMAFLQRELDDPNPQPCGYCANCVGEPLLPVSFSSHLAEQAVQFLRCNEQIIEPRRFWPQDALAARGWHGPIPLRLRAEPGRALCVWGDAGWGSLVRRGKQEDGHFDDSLVHGSVAMIETRWRPNPHPAWVTCVPSLRHPTLVPDFARQLAVALHLPFVACVRKTLDTDPQKEMMNSYQQAHNVARAFSVDRRQVSPGAVLLVDDIVDSRWTFTIIAALLREAQSGPVYPVALAITTTR